MRAFLLGVQLFFLSAAANAALTINSATLNGGVTVRVQPGATVTAVVTQTNTAGSNWRSTAWRIDATPPGALSCVNHANHDADGVFTESFAVTAPTVEGTYNAYFRASSNNACGGTLSALFGITGAVVVDGTAPFAASIVAADANPTAAPSVSWTVSFSEAVSGVGVANFSLAQGGAVSGAAIISISGGPSVYTVTASTGLGDGTLGLSLVDNDAIIDLAGNPLGGIGAGNGNLVGQAYTIIRAAAFNVVEPGADALTGRIFTKIAAQDIAVDIVALDASNAVATGFAGTVAVELVDASSGGACPGLPLIKPLANETFVPAHNGRKALSGGQFEAEARRNVKFRVRYPAGSPTVTSCSADSFANRPHSFTSAQARQADRTTPGTATLLNSTANPGTGPVHNAGRPFRIDAAAQNAAGAVTMLYAPDAGEPVAVVSQCGGGAPACIASPGTLGIGSWSAAAGVITTTSAAYSDVGAFALVLEDRSFAGIDVGDGTADAVRFISSVAPLTVGRFVPDHFALDAGSTLTPRSDIAACSGSSFTYMGERMDFGFTLRAREAGGNTTPGYAGTLAALSLASPSAYDFGALDSAAPTALTVRLDTGLVAAISATWSAGVVSIATPLALSRVAAPDGPYASLKIGIRPVDPDGVALAPSALDLDADNSGAPERAQVGPATQVRFGVLRLTDVFAPLNGNASGYAPVAFEARYWDGAAFVTNAADSCTPFVAKNFQLYGHSGAVNAANVSTPTAGSNGSVSIAGSGVLNSGRARVDVARPNPAVASPGSALICVDLDGAAPCQAINPAAKPYLQGRWAAGAYDRDPSARVGFGLYGSQPRGFIFLRENY